MSRKRNTMGRSAAFLSAALLCFAWLGSAEGTAAEGVVADSGFRPGEDGFAVPAGDLLTLTETEADALDREQARTFLATASVLYYHHRRDTGLEPLCPATAHDPTFPLRAFRMLHETFQSLLLRFERPVDLLAREVGAGGPQAALAKAYARMTAGGPALLAITGTDADGFPYANLVAAYRIAEESDTEGATRYRISLYDPDGAPEGGEACLLVPAGPLLGLNRIECRLAGFSGAPERLAFVPTELFASAFPKTGAYLWNALLDTLMNVPAPEASRAANLRLLSLIRQKTPFPRAKSGTSDKPFTFEVYWDTNNGLELEVEGPDDATCKYGNNTTWGTFTRDDPGNGSNDPERIELNSDAMEGQYIVKVWNRYHRGDWTETKESIGDDGHTVTETILHRRTTTATLKVYYFGQLVAERTHQFDREGWWNPAYSAEHYAPATIYPDTAPSASDPPFLLKLSWDTNADLNLCTQGPNAETLWYGNHRTQWGQLLYDNPSVPTGNPDRQALLADALPGGYYIYAKCNDTRGKDANAVLKVYWFGSLVVQHGATITSNGNTGLYSLHWEPLVESHREIDTGESNFPWDVRLRWNTNGDDLDLHCYGPDGQHCYYSNRHPSWGSLDRDDTDGYGPEIIATKQSGPSGYYTVKVYSYGLRWASPKPCTATLNVYWYGILTHLKSHDFSGSGQWWDAFTLRHFPGTDEE